jgi:chitinase
VTIGGWTGSKYFSSLVSSDWARRDFVGQIVNFVNTYQFDGVDIDWEYPCREANREHC